VSAASDALPDELRALARRALGAEVRALEPLAGGLGHRRFFRLRLAGTGPATCIARVDRGEPAPGVPPEPPLEPTRAFLEAHGLPVPRRLGGDATGIDLLEDVGSLALRAVAPAAPAAQRRALYEEACDLVPRLQRLRDASGHVPAFGRRLDGALLALKARRFCAASLPACLGREPTAGEREAVSNAFAVVREAVEGAPLRFAHRDLQAANLLVDEARPPGARLVMIDLQGAFLAPPEYDLVCLLRDSYVVLGDDEARALAERVRPALPDAPSPDAFAWRFDLLTIARKAKDHALFHEVAARGDPSWLRFAPATLGYLRTAAARLAGRDPRLARFAALADALDGGGAPCAR
jgi:aminoglycoside/choline kinase family phosphotransferase